MRCAECSSQFEGYHTTKFCSKDCSKEFNDKKYWEKKIRDSHAEFYDESNLNSAFVECGICGYRTKDLAQHPSIHAVTQDEYREKFGLIKCQEKRDSIKGENNPWHNHGGTLSPFSTKFVGYKDKDPIENINETKRKATETKVKNSTNPLTLDYHTKNGVSLEEAKRILRNRQTTFSLDKCVQQYGEENGVEVWLKRQNKWQKTLDAKSIEEKLEINRRKSAKVNYKSLWTKQLNEDGHFYILRINEKYMKFGITSRKSINERYKEKDLRGVEVIEFRKMQNINHAFQTEQLIKKKFSKFITPHNRHKNFGWTEVLEYGKLQELYDEFEYRYLDYRLVEEQFNDQFKLKH